MVDLFEECCGWCNCNVIVWWIYFIKCEYVMFFWVIYECVESKYVYLVFFLFLKVKNIKCIGVLSLVKKLFCF